MKYAQAVGHQAKDIDGKVCNKSHGGGSSANKKSLCGGGSSAGGASSKFSEFGEGVTLNSGDWPNATNEDRGSKKAVDLVAADLTKLTRHEKNTVAGLLSKTVKRVVRLERENHNVRCL